MTVMDVYELKRFGLLYECISDYQSNCLSNRGLFIGFTKNLLIILANYLVLEAFKNPETEVSEKEHRLIVMDENNEQKLYDGASNYVEYVI